MSDERPDRRTDDAARRLEDLLAEHREPDDGAGTDAGAGTADGAGTDDVALPASAEPFDPFAPASATDPLPPGQAGGEQTTGEDDPAEARDGLPEAPLFALLRNIEKDVGIDRIDRIWVFPPRRHQAGETAVVVVAAFLDVQDDRRRVYAAHYTVHEEAREPRLAMDEYGTAPTDRVGRLVEEVVERIKDEPAAAPRSHSIEGRDDRWNTVLHALAEAYLDEVRRNPRLRR